MKRIEFEGKVHEFPDDFTDADVAAALGGGGQTQQPPGLMDRLRGAVQSADVGGKYQALRGGVDTAIDFADRLGIGSREDYVKRRAAMGMPPASESNPMPRSLSSGLAETAVGAFVPKRPGGTPMLTAKPGVKGAAQRVGAAVAGGEVGGQLEGETTGMGALKGGGPVAVAESVSPVVSFLRRSMPGAARKIAADDAARVGAALDEAAPTLQPGRTAPEMQRTAEGQGLTRIGAAKENVVADLEAQLKAIPKQTPDFTDAKGVNWVRVPGGGWQKARAAGEIPMPSLGEPSMTLRDANAKLSEIGDMMRGIKPLDPRFPKDVDLKVKYGEVVEDIRKGIAGVVGPEAAQRWASGQAQYRAGRFIGDDVLGRTGAFKQGEFNITDLQRWLKNPENRADLARATGGDLGKGTKLDAYNRIVNSITRGAEPGMSDRMAGEAPGLLSGRGSYGAWRVPAEIGRRLLPNASSRYIGRLPGAIDPSTQAVLDLLGQRAADR